MKQRENRKTGERNLSRAVRYRPSGFAPPPLPHDHLIGMGTASFVSSRTRAVAAERAGPPASAEGAPAREEIALRAYFKYEARGRQDGRDLDDWLEAEKELRQEISSGRPPAARR